MDYMAFVEYHQASQADITIGCLPCDDERAQDFGLMKIDDAGQVIVRLEPPQPDSRSHAFCDCPGAKPLTHTAKVCLCDLTPRRCSNACMQDFAEKPKGDALKAMQVDTTVLGALVCSHVSP